MQGVVVDRRPAFRPAQLIQLDVVPDILTVIKFSHPTDYLQYYSEQRTVAVANSGAQVALESVCMFLLCEIILGSLTNLFTLETLEVFQ